MGFLAKVNALTCVEADIQIALKPIKYNSAKKKAPKARAPNAPSVAPSASEGKGEKVGFSELTNTKKLIPFIKKALQLTDPFNFTNETWARFIRTVSPKLFTALLLDMNIVPRERKAEFARYLERRLRTMAKT